MDKIKSLYAIYKFDFHKSIQRTIQAEAEGIDGNKYLSQAQRCFASLFDQNSIEKLAKMNKKGEVITMLPNDVLAKGCDGFITGDVKHDIFVDAYNAGLTVFDAGHYYTENIFCGYMENALKEHFPDAEVNIAETSGDVVEWST